MSYSLFWGRGATWWYTLVKEVRLSNGIYSTIQTEDCIQSINKHWVQGLNSSNYFVSSPGSKYERGATTQYDSPVGRSQIEPI